MQTYECDVAVIGGGMGGVAAALAAADGGASVLLACAFDWLGGQMTSQGVSALDEHQYIEQFGGTRSYGRMREAIRAHYRARGAPAAMPDGKPLNPGNGWVSHLCFEPAVGAAVLEAMLAEHVAAGRLTILRRVHPMAATLVHDRVVDVTLATEGDERVLVRAALVLDATELGDLLPLTGTAYVTGAEAQADTGEPHAAPDGPRPTEVQSFTFPFAVEHRPGEDHTIARPAEYEHLRDQQPYSLVLYGHDGEPRPFRMFEDGPTGLPPFWTYRRLVDAELLGTARDIAMINWHGNDYYGGNLLDAGGAERERIIGAAKRLALGFLYWLQTEAPREGAGRGYPGLRLLPEVMGSRDGLSQEPYIREARRIVARKRIVQSEIAAAGRRGARAELFRDSVGIGWYSIDLHPCVGNAATMYASTLPFQIPLGALLPERPLNLIAAAKNIGTTHLTNGAYRLHPVEWNIGEAAGALAAFCAIGHCSPHAVYDDPARLRRFQRHLLERGVPLAWTIDLDYDDPVFVASQLLVLAGAIVPTSPRYDTLELGPDRVLNGDELQALCAAAGVPATTSSELPTWRQAVTALDSV